MRKTMVAIALCALCLPTMSQAQELRLGVAGSSLLQGEVSLSYTSGSTTVSGRQTDLPSELDVLLGPSYGYFVINGLMLGIVVDYHRKTVEDAAANTEAITNGFLVGFRPAYYLPLMPSRALNLYFRGLLGFALDGTTNVTGNTRTTTEYSGFAGGAGIGVAFGFGGYWGGVLQLGVDYTFRGLSGVPTGSNIKESREEHVISVGTSMGVYF